MTVPAPKSCRLPAVAFASVTILVDSLWILLVLRYWGPRPPCSTSSGGLHKILIEQLKDCASRAYIEEVRLPLCGQGLFRQRSEPLHVCHVTDSGKTIVCL